MAMNSQCYPSPGPADNLSFLWSGQPFPSDRMAQRMHLSSPERQPHQGKEASCTCAGTVTRLWEAFRAKTAMRALLSTNRDSPTPRPHAQSSTPPATPRDETCGLAGSPSGRTSGRCQSSSVEDTQEAPPQSFQPCPPWSMSLFHSPLPGPRSACAPLSISEGRDPEVCLDIKLQKGDWLESN